MLSIMEILSKLRWFIGGFILLIVVILLIWGLISIANNIFTSSDDASIEDIANRELLDVDVAQFTVGGPIVATKEHRSYVVEVNPSVVTMTLYSDYGQKELEQKSYKNNQDAFDSFVEALDNANVLARESGTDEEDDLQYEGACSLGRRYIVTLDDIDTRWTTSCRLEDGTMGGDASVIRRLFDNQVPDARDILQGTGLYRR